MPDDARPQPGTTCRRASRVEAGVTYYRCSNPACPHKGAFRHPDDFRPLRNPDSKCGRNSWCRLCERNDRRRAQRLARLPRTLMRLMRERERLRGKVAALDAAIDAARARMPGPGEPSMPPPVFSPPAAAPRPVVAFCPGRFGRAGWDGPSAAERWAARQNRRAA